VGSECASGALHGGTCRHHIVDEHEVFGNSGACGRKGVGNIDASSAFVELSLRGGIAGSFEAVTQRERGAFGDLPCDEGALVEATLSKPRPAERDWDDMGAWAREHARARAVDEPGEVGGYRALAVKL